MKTFTTILLKKKWILKNSSPKRPHLFEKNKRLPGKILCVIFNKFSTFFEVSDYVKTSKKQRSNVVDLQIKDIFQYNFIGICIAQKKDQFLMNTNYIIRNTFDRQPYEMTINLFSPIIELYLCIL
jgi:ribosomal protein L19